jgi:hypothetical protein
MVGMRLRQPEVASIPKSLQEGATLKRKPPLANSVCKLATRAVSLPTIVLFRLITFPRSFSRFERRRADCAARPTMAARLATMVWLRSSTQLPIRIENCAWASSRMWYKRQRVRETLRMHLAKMETLGNMGFLNPCFDLRILVKVWTSMAK